MTSSVTVLVGIGRFNHSKKFLPDIHRQKKMARFGENYERRHEMWYGLLENQDIGVLLGRRALSCVSKR